MSILAQPIIAAPTFADTAENRLHLIAVAELAISTQPTRSDFFSQVHTRTGADWLVIRNIIKGLPLQTVEKSKYLKILRDSAWFDENRLLAELARQIRSCWHDFEVFANVFSEFRITLQSLQTLILTSKKLRNHDLHRETLLEEIALVINADESTLIKALPVFFGYAFAGSQFYWSDRQLSKIDDNQCLVDTDDQFWREFYGFNFDDFNCQITVENDDNSVLIEIHSTIVSISGLEFDVTENTSKNSVPAYLRAVLRSAIRGDSARCHRIFSSSTGYAPRPSTRQIQAINEVSNA